MNQPAPASSSGAYDLSGMAGSPQPDQGPSHFGGPQPGQGSSAYNGPQQAQDPSPYGAPVQGFPAATGGPLIDAPLVVDVTQANFEDVMALSQTVPVVLLFTAASSLASGQALRTAESVARKSQGAFQLGKVDAASLPELVEAFQLQSLPAGVALLARRPVPLFEGAPTETDLESVLSELLQVAPQMGVVGRINVSATDLEEPIPDSHLPAREAEGLGDWQKAIAAWQKVLASNPADREAKTALTRARFQLRQEEAEAEAATSAQVETGAAEAGAAIVLGESDALFAAGQEQAAFEALLSALSSTKDKDEKEQLRARLVELFQIASDVDAVKSARTRLATILMV